MPDMKAVVIHAAQDLRIEDHKVSEPDAGQVLVYIERGGICGSDLHYFNHGGFGAILLKEPMILGHEVAGRIAAVGAGVDTLRVGDAVAVSPSRPCLTCDMCGRGWFNHCRNMRFYGSAMPFPHIQGAFRNGLVADVGQCVKADGISLALAAMAEPFAVALHAVERSGGVAGKRVLVTGCGPIGVLCILAALNDGAAEIVATDLAVPAREMALRVGASLAVEPADIGDGFDVMFECSGAAAALAGGLAALAPRGVLVQLGLGGEMTVPINLVTAKEITVVGSFRFHDEFAKAVALMQSGAVDPSPLLTHTFPMGDAVTAFKIAGDRTQAMKVQLDFTAD